jgi:hypothetical protein
MMYTMYKVRNRVTYETRVVEADNAQAACYKCGWLIRDCHVKGYTTPQADNEPLDTHDLAGMNAQYDREQWVDDSAFWA